MKNEDRHVLDELSAYIDGEARDPARIARHLQGCADCARRHLQLLKLGAHLRTMSLPDVRPEFATRVMARIAEQESAPAPFRRRRIVDAMAVAALVALCAGLFSLWLRQDRETAPAQLVAKSIELRDSDAVVGAFVELFDEGVDAELVEETLKEPTWEHVYYSSESIWELLAEVRPEDVSLGFSDADNDLFSLIDGLDAEEHDTLRELLLQRYQAVNQNETKG